MSGLSISSEETEKEPLTSAIYGWHSILSGLSWSLHVLLETLQMDLWFLPAGSCLLMDTDVGLEFTIGDLLTAAESAKQRCRCCCLASGCIRVQRVQQS